MIFLRIFLGIIWALLTPVCFILCGINVSSVGKVLRVVSSLFLGISILLAYFTFPFNAFLIISLLELFFYLLYGFMQAQIVKGKLPGNFWAWIFVEQEDTLVSIVFPMFLAHILAVPALWILSLKKRFNSNIMQLRHGIGQIDIDVQTNDAKINIHI